MTQIAVAAICGGIWLATRITKAIVIKKLNDREKVLEAIVAGINDYSGTKKKLSNKDIKKIIATQIKKEIPGLKKVMDRAIHNVEYDPKRGTLNVLCNVVLKILNVLL